MQGYKASVTIRSEGETEDVAIDGLLSDMNKMARYIEFERKYKDAVKIEECEIED